MSTAVLTKPRTLNSAAAMRIINSVRTDGRTWLAACLFPCKLFVAIAFLWVIKANAELPHSVEWPWDYTAYYSAYVAGTDLSLMAENVAYGYFLCFLLLILGMLFQVGLCANRAALASGLFALAALIIGLIIMNFADGVFQLSEFFDRAGPVL